MDEKTYVGAGHARNLEEATSEVDRELQVRRRCYSRWIDDGKMSSVDAMDRFERLEAASAALHKMLALQPPKESKQG